jgi:hypothetical protein
MMASVPMRISILTATLILASLANAEDTSFRDVKVANPDGSQTKAVLAFNDEGKTVTVRAVSGTSLTVPYDHIDGFSYEFTKKHRVRQGAAVGIVALSPGAFLVLALTKSRSHWLEMDFHEQAAAKSLVLRLDKRSYLQVCDAAKQHGKEVVILGKTDTKSVNAKIKTSQSR